MPKPPMTTELLRKHLNAPYQADYFQRQVLNLVFGSALKIDTAAQSIELTTSEGQVLRSLKRYGSIRLNDGRELDLYEALLQPQVQPERAKIGIGMMVKKHIFGLNAALVCFVNPERTDSWRFSFIARGSKIENGKRVDDDSNPQRYTYVFGPAESCRTAAERFQVLSFETNLSIDSFLNAFEVEKLSAGFFEEYKYTHYSRFIESISGCSVKKKGKKDEWAKNRNAATAYKTFFNADEKRVRDFCKKLLGRVVFLYFLQKKGWLGVSEGEEWGAGDKNFLQNLYSKCPDKENFYSNYLSKLFFETLNNDKQKHIVQEFIKGNPLQFPYLNGGLFEKDDNDPDWITFKPLMFEELFEFFNRYNFTVYEDSTDEHTVAVDPEMLGHIFENLLEDNKDKGAFYTPKEIVHYMCQASLTEYLNTRLNIFEVPLGYTGEGLDVKRPKSKPGQLAITQTDERNNIRRDELEDFVRNKNANAFIHENAEKIDKLLDTVKICDPAIGSGAFPMGLLHEIFQLKMVLHDFVFANSGKLFHYKNYSPGTYRSDVKLNIIENSIYGVDIEKGAVDIARLRFWLSLVVDENEPRALPNLDYKIVVGNSLLPKFGDEVIDLDWNLQERELIKNEQRKMRDAFTRLIVMERSVFEGKGNKTKLQIEIRALKIELLLAQLEINRIKYTEAEGKMQGKLFGTPTKEEALKAIQVKERLATFANATSQLKSLQKNKEPLQFFDWALDFPEVMNPLISDKTGFDIVIGNPPYGASISRNENPEFSKVFAEILAGELETYILFYHVGVNILKQASFLSFITPDSWLTNRGAAQYRKWVNLKADFVDVFDHYKPFEAAKDTRVHSVLFAKGKQVEVVSIKQKMPSNPKLVYRVYEVPQHIIKQFGEAEWRLYLTSEERKIFDKMETTSSPLEKLYNLKYGLRTGDNEKYVTEKETKYPLIAGADIAGLYALSWKPKYLKTTTGLSTGYFKEYFTEKKIIIQYVRTNSTNIHARWIEATYVEGNYIPLNSLNYVYSKTDKHSLHYVLAILNSFLINRYYRAYYTDVNVKPTYLAQLPIPIADAKTQKLFNSIVSKILATKDAIPKADTSVRERGIDLMVYKLYNLGWDELITIEGSEQKLHTYTNSLDKGLNEKIFESFKEVEDVVFWWEGK